MIGYSNNNSPMHPSPGLESDPALCHRLNAVSCSGLCHCSYASVNVNETLKNVNEPGQPQP